MSGFRYNPRWWDAAETWQDMDQPTFVSLMDQRDIQLEAYLSRTGLLDATITSPAAEDFLYYNGTTWVNTSKAYTSFVTTFTNLTVGNGTTTGRYVRLGGLIHFVGQFLFGSTSSVTGDVTGTLPVNPFAGLYITGTGSAVDSSLGSIRTTGLSEIFTSGFGNAIHFAWTGSSGTGSTTPITWANGDLLGWNITYPIN